MVLYIVRHAEAVEAGAKQSDEWRHLTHKGRQATTTMAKTISKYGHKPRRIISSPLTRAVQTAEIVAGYACSKHTVEASMLLMPGNDIKAIVKFLDACHGSKRVMLVGHEPQLGKLVAVLLGSKKEFSLEKGTCVALELAKDENQAEFLYYLVPGKKPITSINKAFDLQ